MFFGTFREHHTWLYEYHILTISKLNNILCYLPDVIGAVAELVLQPHAVPSVGGGGGSSRSDDDEKDKKKYKPRRR